MSEIAGPAARLLPRLKHGDDLDAWAEHGAGVLNEVLHLTAAERAQRSAQGLAWASRFGIESAVDRYLQIYEEVLAWEQRQPFVVARAGA
jgi:uracil DNA glycosylase